MTDDLVAYHGRGIDRLQAALDAKEQNENPETGADYLRRIAGEIERGYFKPTTIHAAQLREIARTWDAVRGQVDTLIAQLEAALAADERGKT